MSSVGEKLRQERIRQGIDLAVLAQNTRINQKYLQAIEDEEPENVPGAFFYRSFVRQYAQALGMDAAELDAELDRIKEAEAPKLEAALTETRFPIKQPDPIVTESNRRYLGTGRVWASVMMLLAVLVGCSAFYTWWHRIESQAKAPVLEVASAPEHSTPASTPTTTPTSTPANEVPAPATSAPPDAAPAAADTKQAMTDAKPAMTAVPTQSVVTTTDASGSATQVALPPDAHVIIDLSATEKTWVAVSSDGKRIFSGTLEPSETRVLGGKERFWIRVGNAGGLEIKWNGKSIGPIGPKGQVRTVVFTPDKYQILQPGDSM